MNDFKDPAQLEQKAQEVIARSIAYQSAILSGNVQNSIRKCVGLREVVKEVLRNVENTESRVLQYDKAVKALNLKTRELQDLKKHLNIISSLEKREDRVSNRIILTLSMALSMAFSPFKSRLNIGKDLDESFIETLLSQINITALLSILDYPKGYMTLKTVIENSVMTLVNAEISNAPEMLRRSIQAINGMQALELAPLLLRKLEKSEGADKMGGIMQLWSRILKDEDLIRLADDNLSKVKEIFSPEALNKVWKDMQPLHLNLSAAKNEILYTALIPAPINTFIAHAKEQLEAANAANTPGEYVIPNPGPYTVRF